MANHNILLQAEYVDNRTTWERRTDGISGHFAELAEQETAERLRLAVQGQNAKIAAEARDIAYGVTVAQKRPTGRRKAQRGQ